MVDVLILAEIKSDPTVRTADRVLQLTGGDGKATTGEKKVIRFAKAIIAAGSEAVKRWVMFSLVKRTGEAGTGDCGGGWRLR